MDNDNLQLFWTLLGWVWRSIVWDWQNYPGWSALGTAVVVIYSINNVAERIQESRNAKNLEIIAKLAEQHDKGTK